MDIPYEDVRIVYANRDHYGDRSDFPSLGIVARAPEIAEQIEWMKSVIEQPHSMGPVYRLGVRTKATIHWLEAESTPYNTLCELCNDLQGLFPSDSPQYGGFIKSEDFAVHDMGERLEKVLPNVDAIGVSYTNHLHIFAEGTFRRDEDRGRPSFLIGDIENEQTGRVNAEQLIDWLCR